jgi:membrane peptidoglycan carboxypeptidase
LSYYGHPCSELRASEVATLVARALSNSRAEQSDALQVERDFILKRLLDTGVISQAGYDSERSD